LLLMRGLVEQRAEVDSMIRQAATNWTLERMSLVDRAILRTATYEMAFVKKVPVATAINDAIELAKNMEKLIRRLLSTVFWIASARI